MRRFSRVGLVAMVSVVLVSIGIGFGVLVVSGGSGSDEKVTIDKPVAYDGERPGATDEEITKSGAEGFKREAHKLAGKLLTPQLIVNTYYIANAITAVDPTP